MKRIVMLSAIIALGLASCTDDDAISADQGGWVTCSPGALRCSGNVLQYCGSNQWLTQQTCTNGCNPLTLACVEGGTGTIPQECTPGTAVCEGNTLKICAGGYYTVTPCSDGCDAASKSCIQNQRPRECNDGDSLCDGNTLKQCRDGYYASTNCPLGCDPNTRSCILPDNCTEGERTCDGTSVKQCEGQDWVVVEDCPNGCAADNVSCNADTVGCTENETKCEGSVAWTCMSGEWLSTLCVEGCDAAGKACAECKTDKCEGDQKTVCSGGNWVTPAQTCPYGCNDAGTDCAAPESCTEGEVVCSDKELKTCTGGSWQKTKDCPDGCNSSNTDCFTKVCNDGDKRCNNDGVSTCKDNAWGAATPCPNGCDSTGKACAPAVNNNVPTRYLMKSSTHNSPITPYVVAQMKAIASKNSARVSNIIMKVGDSHYDADIQGTGLTYGFMRCFSNSTSAAVTLDGRNELQSAIDAFQKTKDSWIRDSVAAVGGESTRNCLSGSPNHLATEINTMNPRFAVFGHGSNDLGNGGYTFNKINGVADGYPWAIQDYYRQMNKALDQMVSGGIIPLVQGVAPNFRKESTVNYFTSTATDPRDYPRYAVQLFDAVSKGVAEYRQIPWFDTYNAFMPLPNHGLRDDNIHESTNGSSCNFTADGLKYGANVRNLGLIQALYNSWQTVINGMEAPDAVEEPFTGSGTSADPFVITSLPYTHSGDTSKSSNSISQYSCSTAGEGGPEYYYKLELKQKTRLKMFAVSASGVDVDIHVMKGKIGSENCVMRSDILIMGYLDPGTYYISVDTYEGSSNAGRYLMGVITCMDDDQRCDTALTAY